MAGCSDGREGKKTLLPKPEAFDYDELPPPSYATFSGHAAVDNVASSSGGNLRSFFIGMGFSPSLVDKAIEENGEENSDLLLEVLLTYSSHISNSDLSDSLEGFLNTSRGRRSAPNIYPDSNSKEALQKSNSQSSDSLDSLFGDKDSPEISTADQIKEEPDEFTEFIDDKRGSLLMMNFSEEEVDFAIHKLGMQASVPDLVDFIFAAQIAKKMNRETIDITRDDTANEGSQVGNEKLFGILAKTLQLLEMGFSENEVSSAIDTLGTEVPISELANFIFAEQSGIPYVMEYKYPSTSTYSMGIKTESVWDLHIPPEVKAEVFSDEPLQSRPVNIGDSYHDNGKRVKEEEGTEEFHDGVSGMTYAEFMENDRGKRPKYEYDDAGDDSSSFLDALWMEDKVDAKVARMLELHRSNPCRRLGNLAEKSPFFLYGNVSNIAYESWEKMSKFIYGVEPEFVNTESFSALNRIEGYIHNLPVEGRAHILPKPPMTIEDAMPRSKKWWPSWDTRKQLNSICCETGGIPLHCDRLGRIIAESGGSPTYDQQNHIVRCCNALNLVWTGKYKLSPIDPEKLELILGYPLEHTASESNLAKRLQLLKYCFQTDTLAYHLSVLKPLFPNGLTVLSIFSGIGGAELALHRLGIKMKAVVSVETSETKRKILERWWRTSGQKGNLVQVEDIQRLNSKTLQGYISKFGMFDLVIYQHPCSYASSTVSAGGRVAAFDFSLFVESVRLLQRVRGLCGRR